LNNVLTELIRLRGPIPTNPPRLCPGKMIADTFVPAGTIVSNLPYSTHRDPSVFLDPESFSPDRWTNPTPQMKAMYRPFGTGPRNCIGMHLAKMQLLMVTCALYQRFEIRLDPRTTEEMMVLRDQGLMTPMGKQLWVRIKERK
jgi:cytochrome P450